ncbi:MAG: hypothetical protein V4643_00125 [Bacteroidota bacterium]
MKILYPLISLFLLFHLFSSCSTDCPDNTPTTNYVDQAYLPDIIPYSDTSTRRFLKNGSDTLVFTSQGLKEIFESGSTLSGDCPKSYKNQKLSLKMAASDTDFFEILFTSTNDIKLSINDMKFDNLFWVRENIYDQNKELSSVFIDEFTVLNNTYTSVTKISSSSPSDYFVNKGKYGLIKIAVKGNVYELIN